MYDTMELSFFFLKCLYSWLGVNELLYRWIFSCFLMVLKKFSLTFYYQSTQYEFVALCVLLNTSYIMHVCIEYLYILDLTFPPRMPQRRPALSSIVNQRSPLMMSLLPSPKERSPHLFLGNQAGGQSPLQAGPCDTKVLMEELNQQLATLRWCKRSPNMLHRI